MDKHVGKVIRVIFKDHTEDWGSPVTCEVIGKINNVGEDHINVVCWDVDTDDIAVRGDNAKIFTILKSTILDFFVYGKGRRIRTWE